jgi:hypothetical protein
MAAVWRSSNSVKAQAAPTLCSADERAEHKFEHRLFPEAAGDDFEYCSSTNSCSGRLVVRRSSDA